MEPDTYFFSSQEALKIASQQNRSDDVNQQNLQVCYYNGDKLDSDLPNLIHMPIDNIVDGLGHGLYRIPTHIDFTGLELSLEIKQEIEKNIQMSLSAARMMREDLNVYYKQALKNKKLDFSEPLRFYIPAHSCTRVMQYVSKKIAEALRKKGYDVLFNLEIGVEDYGCIKRMLEYNPHVCVNINYFRNDMISDDVFNFVWFQDPMLLLTADVEVTLRERDYIFSLLSFLDEFLIEKNIPFQRQSFCVNDSVFKMDKTVQRERKIVFIGSSYFQQVQEENLGEVTKYLISLYHKGTDFTDKVVQEIAQNYNFNDDFVRSRLIPYIIRDITLLELIKVSKGYEIEIYGHGWDRYEELNPFYKGVLKYGEDITKIYNSATFAFAPHQSYMLQQRTFEASACGAIPIVYDCRNTSDEAVYDEAMYFFKTSEDLEKILQIGHPKKNFERLLKDNSYDTFVDKIISIIDDNLKVNV